VPGGVRSEICVAVTDTTVALAPPTVTLVSATFVKPQPITFVRSPPVSEPVAGTTDVSVTSPTVTTNEQLDEWLAASVAVHVTVSWPIGNRLPEAGVHDTDGDGSQASIAVTVNVTIAPLAPWHVAERSPAQSIDGAVVSATVTSNAQIAALPAASRAVQVTCVVPIGKTLDDAGAQTIDGLGSQASLAVTPNVTVAPLALVHSRVKLAGHVTDGAVVSETVTVKLHDATFADESVALHVTVVAPIGKTLPEAGAQATVGLASHASAAVAANVTETPLAPAHSRTRSTGHWIVGATASPTATMNEQVDAFDEASVALQ
jgi:hypothetical protein